MQLPPHVKNVNRQEFVNIKNIYPQYGSGTFVVAYLDLHISPTYPQLNLALLFWSSCICIWPGIVVMAIELKMATLSLNNSEAIEWLA